MISAKKINTLIDMSKLSASHAMWLTAFIHLVSLTACKVYCTYHFSRGGNQKNKRVGFGSVMKLCFFCLPTKLSTSLEEFTSVSIENFNSYCSSK